MDHQPRPGVRPKKSARDRLIRLAQTHPTWILGFADEVWWSRVAQPAVRAWTATGRPLRLVEQPVAKDAPKAVACYLDDFDEETMAATIQYARERPTPMTLLGLWRLGGAASRVGAEASAFGRRDAPYLLSFDTTWEDPAETERCIAWTRAAWAEMHRFSDGGLYLNFAGFGEEKEALVRAAYGANYERLVELKTRYDPGNLFRMNQNIRPRAFGSRQEANLAPRLA